jgi:hypothetical protein
LINWGTIKDNHLEGSSPLGKVCIRLSNDKVTGMYTMFGSTEKYMPEEQGVSSMADAKFALEELLRSKTI